MNESNDIIGLITGESGIAAATAEIKGGNGYAQIHGRADFFETDRGVLVAIEAFGLPTDDGGVGRVLGCHIHEGKSCTGGCSDSFSAALGHYNPRGLAHPYHAGDLPPLFENGGYAFLAVMTDRFGVEEIIGRTVVVHSMPDDFTTQPSGGSGEKIACGEIIAM